MLQFALIDQHGVSWGGEELVERWRAAPASLLWIDSDATDATQEARLARELLQAPRHQLRDFQHPRRPPKFDSAAECDLLLLKGLHAETSELEFRTIQLSILIGNRCLFTRHDRESRSIKQLREQLRAGGPVPEAPLELALRICQALCDRYLPIVLALEERLDVVEDEIFERPSDEYLAELTGYRTSLKKLRRYTAYHLSAMATLQRSRESGLTETQRQLVAEIIESLDRLSSLEALFYDMCADLMEGYLSLSAHRLNEIMKVLTILAAIFVPLTFIAGIYGMNFEYMPELQMRWAYFVVLAVMAVLAAGLLIIFRLRRWI